VGAGQRNVEKSQRSSAEEEGLLVLGVAGQLELRWATADVLAVAREARRRHDLSPIAATALGRALAGAALLRALATRACRRLTLTLSGDGPLGRVVAEADSDGNLRGMVGNPHVDLPERPDGKLRIGEALGEGRLRVHRELLDGTSWESQVALVNGEIGLDLAHFLEQSEQTQSAVLVGVLSGPEGLRAAGGLVVEVIPGAGESALRTVERNLERIGSVSRQLATGGPLALTGSALAGLEIEERERSPLRFRCSCRREELLARLATLSAADREAIADEAGRAIAQCAFCGAAYVFDPEEYGGAPRTH
jgi:molecular chaperone Hsp33